VFKQYKTATLILLKNFPKILVHDGQVLRTCFGKPLRGVRRPRQEFFAWPRGGGEGLALARGLHCPSRRRTATRQANRFVALRFHVKGIGARFRARSGSRAGLRQALAIARYAADPRRHSLTGKGRQAASACLREVAVAVNRERVQARCRRPIGGFKRIAYRWVVR
jgi:hypothetical protein